MSLELVRYASVAQLKPDRINLSIYQDQKLTYQYLGNLGASQGMKVKQSESLDFLCFSSDPEGFEQVSPYHIESRSAGSSRFHLFQNLVKKDSEASLHYGHPSGITSVPAEAQCCILVHIKSLASLSHPIQLPMTYRRAIPEPVKNPSIKGLGIASKDSSLTSNGKTSRFLEGEYSIIKACKIESRAVTNLMKARVYKRGVLPLINILLEGKVLVRTKLACCEARRPLTYNFQIEIVYQVWQKPSFIAIIAEYGIRRVIDDAAKRPSLCRELAIEALLYNIMEGSSSRTILKVVKSILKELCENREPKELNLISGSVVEITTQAIYPCFRDMCALLGGWQNAVCRERETNSKLNVMLKNNRLETE
ncbi:hypothetical protein VNO77_21772 [Canavalia gladiata]|uniref:Uncharacterized protein n=1 Tax=Canavalia gladiata TaxID=3824 RepID=A0AAN9L1B9_CANGL